MDARTEKHVAFARHYAANFAHGAPGHLDLLTISSLADQKDSAYTERDSCVCLIAQMALALGYRVGMGLHKGDDWDAEWRNIVFVDLPAGQVSWHIHDSEAKYFYFVGTYDGEWDGHTTEEKYRRVLTAGINEESSNAPQ